MTKGFAKCATCLVGAALFAVIPNMALAQDAEPAETPEAAAKRSARIDVITVTAQKREQSIQEVPIAVTAFGAETLRRRNVTDVSQLSNLVPNVTLDATTPFSGSTSILAASIRGIGQNDFAFNFDPGVGVYLDGVYLARSVGANVDLLDIERIEILKGPQGTLFGRNTIGGAISIVTRDPAAEFGYTAEITTGRFNRFDSRGSVDMPISDTFRTSVAFSSKQRDGYQKRIPLPQELIAPGIPDCVGIEDQCTYIVDDLRAFPSSGNGISDREGGQGEWNVRAKALWEASPSFTARFAFDWTHVDQPASANTLLEVTDTSNGPGEPAGLPALGAATNFGRIYNTCISSTDPSSELFFFFPTGMFHNLGDICGFRGTVPGTVPIDDRYTPFYIPAPLASANVDGDPTNNRLPWDGRYLLDDPDLTYATGLSFSELSQWGGALTLDWDISPAFALKSITSHRRLRWAAGMDLDGSPLPQLSISLLMHQKQWSQEIQANGKLFGDKLDYVLGGYYFHEEGDLHDFVTFHSGLLQVDGPNDLETTAWAVFAHVNYALTERLGLTAGLRYTNEEKQFEGFQSDTNAFNYKLTNCYPPDKILIPVPGFPPCQVLAGFPDPTDPLRFFPPGRETRTFSDVTPRVGAEFHVNDLHMLYASWAKGFKSGSWTTRLSAPLPPGDPKRLFDPEKATTYELGLKSEFFDQTMRVNTAVFFTEYTDIQLQQFEAISPTFRNAGDAEIYGGEIELLAVFGEGFTVNASLGYLHDEYTRVEPGVNVGGDLPKAPTWQFNLAPQYEYAMGGNRGTIVLNADYTFRSAVFNDTENNPINSRPDLNILNASVGYRSPDEHWEISVGGTNITDERYVVNGVVQPAAGWSYGTYNPPAEWFAKVRVRY